MLAIALRLFLVLEVAFYASLAMHYFAASPAGAALAALGCVLGLRAGIVLLTYVCAWAYRSPAPKISTGQALGMVLAEYAAFVANFVLILPFERRWMGADRLKPTRQRLPLLLVHGYGCSRGSWWWLRRRLETAGWTVATLSLEPVYTSIDNFVEPLARRIDAVLAETGAERVMLVGHSMGGLVARAYLRRFGAGRVARLVTLGTPHAGSRLSRFGMGQNARQMEPGSAWLRALGEAPAVETIAIYSPHDNFVMPQKNLELAGASLRPIDALGHLAMLFSPRVVEALLAALAAQDSGALRKT